MANLLIYAGFNAQSEVCLWAVLGILRTILDASVAFKVKSNLKQIWQIKMPSELDVQVQRALRTMISGVMFVQCFTVYVYLAAYIILLYPIFLEEKPALVLPWLLLSLIRLLCELVNLSIGLATCVLLGSGKPPCVKLYQTLQTETYKPIAMVLPAFKIEDGRNNSGLELAVRRRRTKSLLGEDELRKNILADLYKEKSEFLKGTSFHNEAWSSEVRNSEYNDQMQAFQNMPMTSMTAIDDEWPNIEVATPRDTDRVLDQFVTMMLRIGVYLEMGLNNESIQQFQFINKSELGTSELNVNQSVPLHSGEAVSPPSMRYLGSGTFSYIHEYPRIFLKNKSQSKLLQDSTNVLDCRRNDRCSKISVVRIKSDSSNKIVLKRLRDEDDTTLEDKSNESENDDDEQTASSSKDENHIVNSPLVGEADVVQENFKSNSDEDVLHKNKI